VDTGDWDLCGCKGSSDQGASKCTKRYSDEYKRDAIELVRSSGRTVTDVARQLGVSSQSLHGWVKKATADEALAHEITVIRLASKGIYGAPRVNAELRRLGFPANRQRLARVMRNYGIFGHTRRTGRRAGADR
jgi:transposase-like protein